MIAATALVVVIFVVDLASGGSLRHASQGAAAAISNTVIRTFSALKYSGFFRTRATLAAQNRLLQTQVEAYQTQSLIYKALQEENAQLAAMAHMAQGNVGITVPVLSSFRSSPYGTFLIGGGSVEDVKLNDLVLTEDGFVVGNITNVNTHTALVSEVLGSGKTVDGLVAGSASSFTGTGGGNARAQIGRGVALAVGDVVTSPTAGARPIGIVGHIESGPASAYSTVYIRLPANIESLRYVFVLTPSK